jgi:uncharacterized protein (DUF697 family)
MAETVASERALIAENLIRKYVAFAVGAGAIPAPIVDIAAITGVQARMIQKLARLYGKAYSDGPVRATILSLTGGTLSLVLGAVTASVIKIVPVVGTLAGSLGLPIVAGASTYAIGQVYLQHFEEGGEPATLKASSFRAAYKTHFAKGKDVAAAAEPVAEEVEQPAA